MHLITKSLAQFLVILSALAHLYPTCFPAGFSQSSKSGWSLSGGESTE